MHKIVNITTLYTAMKILQSLALLSISSLFAVDGKISRISNAQTFNTKSAFVPPGDSEWDLKIMRKSLAVSLWISTSDAIS